jgi:hypothetical protein
MDERPPRLAVATITLARSNEEAALLLASLRELAGRHGLPVYAADGGSIGGFLEALEAVPDLSVRRLAANCGLDAQVKAALSDAAASGAPRILYTEPDKRAYFQDRLAAFLAADDGGAGVHLAARDAASFATFPAGQQLPELLMNRLAGETLGTAGDLCYGPLLLAPSLVPLFLDVEERLGWGWRFFLMAGAHAQGMGVRLWEADLPCPEDQRGEDDLRARLYRMAQLEQNVRGFALGLRRIMLWEVLNR